VLPQVIDLISLKPFDMETIAKSIKKTRKALIVEECMKTGGIGASLSAVINESLFDELDHQVRDALCNMSYALHVTCSAQVLLWQEFSPFSPLSVLLYTSTFRS
jgi:pyruvate/2-oxoglutarate/acetoin dehydrogenase E1 component